tara:strand:- start:570 stop:776 length:207 start_codon:yes stop_codon:yes gene_type:complete
MTTDQDGPTPNTEMYVRAAKQIRACVTLDKDVSDKDKRNTLLAQFEKDPETLKRFIDLVKSKSAPKRN